ncbi:hypothetical protein I5318_06810 [Enterococcus faecium]|uniref:hypothetical protein n=1 Tax=Enterococcus TaxID=1350 RepID=UPI000F665E82|nr:hypothetical protein [Enterococcus faecium]EKQ3345341.1 hypothetical protein [Enterococcus faecium]EKQ3703135.1 hypothetical protein [Enterococcus faecium]MBG7860890.1 hypothetical protein [Enterococcus faecium]MBG8110183.1 hypothetical protein [Enterococcus faecium]MBG8295385.1 hypothetical protein [Enterococcus faecium]
MKIDDFKQNLSDKELNEFIENFDKYKEIRKNLLQQRKKDRANKSDLHPSIKKALDNISKDQN